MAPIVWTEVWVAAEPAAAGGGDAHAAGWIHADSCEAALDQPLLYEAGWGKKLNWIVAFGAREVVDVSARYSDQWPAMLERRAAVDEAWLRGAVQAADAAAPRRARAMLPAQEEGAQAVYAARRADEERALAERRSAVNEGAAAAVAGQGRVTGSLEWRRARGETGKRRDH